MGNIQKIVIKNMNKSKKINIRLVIRVFDIISDFNFEVFNFQEIFFLDFDRFSKSRWDSRDDNTNSSKRVDGTKKEMVRIALNIMHL